MVGPPQREFPGLQLEYQGHQPFFSVQLPWQILTVNSIIQTETDMA